MQRCCYNLCALVALGAVRAAEECSAAVTHVEVTDEHRERFARDGFIAFEGALDAEQLKLWRSTVDSAVAARGNRKFAANSDMEDATNEDFDYFDRVFTQRVNLWMDDASTRKLLLEQAGGAINQIAAALTKRPNGFRLWHDQALYKEPYANPTSWHVDVPYWSFNSTDAISAWVALDNATAENGCLHFLAGSHKVLAAKEDPFAEVKIGKNMDALFFTHPELRTLEPVVVPAPAGTISFHNGLTAHGAGANMTPRRRRAMSFQLMPEGDNKFNGKQNILPKPYFDALEIGEVLNQEEINPKLKL
jgi:phytanoyl-CoA hydroxylase